MLTWRHLRLTKNELYLQSDNHYFPSECYSTSAYLPLQIGMLFFVLGHWVCLHTLHKIPWFHLVSWCGSFRANHTKIAFPQIFHTRKLGEISVFYAILFTLIIVPNHQISLHYKMILTITIMRWWLWIALLALFYQPLIEPRIISPTRQLWDVLKTKPPTCYEQNMKSYAATLLNNQIILNVIPFWHS